MSTISDGITLSLRELGVGREKLGERIREAGIEHADQRGGHPVYRLRDVLALILDASGHGADPSRMCPRDRLDHYRGESEKLKFQKAQRLLVPIDNVTTALATTFKTLALGLETLPDRIEVSCGLNADQVAVMVAIIDAQRQMLYDSLVARSGD